jgi:hypothetical protein
MTSPERIVVTEEDVKPVVVDVGHQLPSITERQILLGAQDVVEGRLSRDASPELVAREKEYAETILGSDG